MLPVTWSALRVFLHVLAATVWVGGQITLAALVPGLRKIDPEAPRAVARSFNRLAWGAFALLVVTGLWNILAIDVSKTSTAWQVTLALKLLLVTASGLGAAAHTRARSTAGLAIWGAVGAIAALAALLVGVLLAGSR